MAGGICFLKTILDYCYKFDNSIYSKTCLKRPLKKKTKSWFSDRVLLNEGQKYCRMLQWEHFAILLTFIKQPFVIKIFVLPILEWPLKTGFTVHHYLSNYMMFIQHASIQTLLKKS